MSQFISTNGWSDIDTDDYFEKLIQVTPIFGSVYYVDKNNKFSSSGDWLPPEDYDLRKRDWYLGAVKEREKIYSQAYVDASTDKIVVTISKPVYNTNGELKGVVGGDVDIEEIMEYIEGSIPDRIGEFFLIDKEGNILAYGNKKYDYYSGFKNIDELIPDILEEILANASGERQVLLQDEEGYISYKSIEGINLIIGNFASFDDYNNSGNYLWKMFLLVFIMIIILFIGFLYIQNKYFLKPLYLLEKDVGNINIHENIIYRVTLDEKDPFLELRKSLNKNLDKIEDLFIQQNEYQEELIGSHEELEASYGQLSAMEQELREQYDELKKREKRLYNLSYYDQLTGLYNRRYYEEELVRLDREENLPLTFIMADVNGLKLINDSFGHRVGDELLKNVANAILASCRKGEVPARIGGDEFIIILPKTDVKGSKKVIKEIRSLADRNNPSEIQLSISFGIGTKYSIGEDISEATKKAEDDMYANKLVEGPSMRSKTIDTIIQTLYEKSPREEAHSTRVSLLCQEMGAHLDMSEEKIKELGMVGLLHDIGKVAISDQVLEKPGRLNKEEWKEMKRHPEVGYRILRTTSEMANISEYVLAHHERWDGEGYPKGLKSENIPLVSRIIAIADAYDAMISDRTYRRGLSEEMAVKEIIKNSGSQFDPILARIFVEKVLKKEWLEEA